LFSFHTQKSGVSRAAGQCERLKTPDAATVSPITKPHNKVFLTPQKAGRSLNALSTEMIECMRLAITF
jgi:hypothetical protein